MRSSAQQTAYFLDTSYIIALFSPRDPHHASAVRAARQMAKANQKLVTTEAVLTEIGNGLSKLAFRHQAARIISELQTNATVQIYPVDPNLFAQAFELYKSRVDKEWGLTDCISFVLMRRLNLLKALTSDQHFKQAGFDIVLVLKK